MGLHGWEMDACMNINTRDYGALIFIDLCSGICRCTTAISYLTPLDTAVWSRDINNGIMDYLS